MHRSSRARAKQEEMKNGKGWLMTRVWTKGMDDVTELLSHYRSMDKKLQQLADVLDIDALAMKAIVLDLAGKREN